MYIIVFYTDNVTVKFSKHIDKFYAIAYLHHEFISTIQR